MKYLIYIATFFISLNVFGQKEKKFIRKGNDHYQKNEFEKANKNYKKALQLNAKSYKADYNLGDALYKQKKYAEAIQQFQKVAESTKDEQLKANAYHNIGNAHLETQKYKESIDAYKKALRYNAKDDETRYNLSYALKKLQEQQKQEQKDKDKNKDKNKDKDKDKEKNKENKDKEKNKNQDKEKQEQQKQEQKQNQLSKKDAEKMLDALNNKERKVQAKLKKKKIKGEKVDIEKDW